MENVKELLALAESQQGYQEKSGDKYLDDFDADAGYKNYQGYNCFATYRAFEKTEKISKEPKAGALIVFNHFHIGRVIDVREGKVYTNEGNTSALYGDRNGGTVRESCHTSFFAIK